MSSLSARRAWIEIINNNYNDLTRPSLSARRAWIEMAVLCLSCVLLLSLSARRAWIEMLASRLVDMSAACRSPQGERG